MFCMHRIPKSRGSVGGSLSPKQVGHVVNCHAEGGANKNGRSHSSRPS